MTPRRWLPLLGSIVVLLGSVRSASADELPDGVGCYKKKVGDDCTAFWKEPTGSFPAGHQGPGRCVDEDKTHDVDRPPVCRPFAAKGIAGVTYADGVCAGKREGDACMDFNKPYDGKGKAGACTPTAHPDHGKILACDMGKVATAAPSAPSSASAPPAAQPSSKGCGCSLPGGTEPAVGVVMALAGLLALGGRRARGAKREG